MNTETVIKTAQLAEEAGVTLAKALRILGSLDF